MHLKLFIIYTLATVLFLSCGKSDNRKTLEDREKEVQQKEQQLSVFEQQLKLKEQDLAKQQKQLDSLKSQNDTLGVFNVKLAGNWQVSMHCTEATCEGYAVGDTKTEQWSIAYEGNKVTVQAMANKKSVRTYSGLFTENSLKLKSLPPPDAQSKMSVTLSPHATNENLMEGQRVIDRGNCRVVFSLKAEKQ
jgi:VCBS repeat-containing protein